MGLSKRRHCGVSDSSQPQPAHLQPVLIGRWLAFFGLAPAILLAAGLASAWSYSNVAEDVNRAGQLRYRSLLARDYCEQKKFDDAKATLGEMKRIRESLGVSHHSMKYFEDESFLAFFREVEQQKTPSFELTMRHLESANRLTGELAASGHTYLLITFFTLLGSLSCLAAALVMLTRANRSLHEQQQRLEQLSRTDGLTGLWNRRHLYSYAASVHQQFQREGRAYCVVLLDVDRFKTINDEHGHARGDEVLVEFAAQLRSFEKGEVFRYGGEEFAWVMPELQLPAAEMLAEKMRQLISSKAFQGLVLTASFGVAQARRSDTISTLLERADAALYRAKSRSRNCIELETADAGATLQIPLTS
jgi:diguanylate cyclase (GGDEF)-like protein